MPIGYKDNMSLEGNSTRDELAGKFSHESRAFLLTTAVEIPYWHLVKLRTSTGIKNLRKNM